MKLVNRFCQCIKSVKKTVKVRQGSKKGTSGKEQAAIAICVKSVLQSRGRTLKKFKCRKTKNAQSNLITQALKKN